MHDTDALRLVNALSAIDLRLQLLEEDDLTPSQASQSRLARHALRTQIETIRHRRLDLESKLHRRRELNAKLDAEVVEAYKSLDDLLRIIGQSLAQLENAA